MRRLCAWLMRGLVMSAGLVCMSAISSAQPSDPASSASAARVQSPTAIFTHARAATVVIRAEKRSGASDAELGNGFLVSPDGVIVTNYHVVRNATRATAVVEDAGEYPIDTILECDAWRDVCLVQIEASRLASLALGDPEQVARGQEIFLVGNPVGTDYVLSRGTVKDFKQIGDVMWMELEIRSSAGHSGSPVLNARGEVIGVFTFTDRASGSGLALRIDEAGVGKPSTRKRSFAEFGRRTAYLWETVERHLIEAAEALDHGVFSRAIASYEQALSGDVREIPAYTLAETYKQLGYAYGAQGEQYKRIDFYEKAVQLDPRDATIWQDLGAAFGRIGYFEKSVECLKRTLEETSDVSLRTSAYLNLAVTYSQTGELDLAIDALERAIELGPAHLSADVYTQLGLMYLSKGDRRAAFVQYEKLRALNRPDLAAPLLQEINRYE